MSATAEQFGGAVGIAVLYLIFHATYLNQLQAKIAASPLPAMTRQQGQHFKDALAAAESTGLQPKSFNSSLAQYLLPARAASEDGYSAAFVAVSVLCLVALVLMILLIRKPPGPPEPAETTPAESRAGACGDTDPEVRYGDRSPEVPGR